MAHNPALDVATFLSGAGIGLTLGANLFVGSLRAESALVTREAVFVSGGSSTAPSRVMGQGSETRFVLVSVRIRWSRFQEGDALSRSILNAMRAASLPGYLDTFSVQSEPLLLSVSSEGRYFWFMSFTLS